MAYNGSGTFTRNNGVNTGSTVWGDDRDGGTLITAARHDSHDQDLANGLTNCICKDGQTTVTADIPFNDNDLTQVSTVSSSSGNTLTMKTIGAANLQFQTDSTTRMIIDSSGYVRLTASANLISANTSDGTDNSVIYVAGGGSNAANRGAYLEVYGNEQATPGRASLVSGDASNSNIILSVESSNGTIDFRTGSGTSRWLVESDGDLVCQGAHDLDMGSSGYFVTNSNTVAAAGSSQGTATSITTQTVWVTAADGTKGVVLPDVTSGTVMHVHNSAGSILKLYPNSGASINNAASNAAVDVPAYGLAVVFRNSFGSWSGGVGVNF